MKHLFMALCCAIVLSLALPGASLAVSYGGHDYYLTSQGFCWTDAQAEAVSLGGNLVTINDAAEESWLQTTFGTGWLWIGFTDQAVEGNWQWISGEPVTYTNWAGGEPNNYGGEDYAVMNWIGIQWNDLPNCYASIYGIIEVVPTPLPGSLLLLGSGLLGLMGLKRRKA